MEIIDYTLRTNEIAYQSICDAIEATKKFIRIGMINNAVEELDHIKRMVTINHEGNNKAFRNQQDLIDNLMNELKETESK